MTTLVKMANGFQSIWTFNQVGQNKMTSSIKMDNGVLIKWDVLCYLISKNIYKLVQAITQAYLHTNLFISLPNYLPRRPTSYDLATYIIAYILTSYNLLTYLPSYLLTYLPCTSYLPRFSHLPFTYLATCYFLLITTYLPIYLPPPLLTNMQFTC